MATEAQVRANRSNAEKSTGPRTAEGKATAAQNSLKHGLFAREGVIRGEDRQEYEMHREMLLEELGPVGPLEGILAARVVDLTWRLRRAAQDQNEAFGALYDRYVARQAAGPEAEPTCGQSLPPTRSGDARDTDAAEERGALLGRMILEDFSQEAVLERLLRYERRIESSLYRTLNELRRVHDQGRQADQEVAGALERWREEDAEARKTRAFACDAPVDGSPGPGGGTTNTARAEVAPASEFPLSPFINPVPDPPPEDETCKTNPISQCEVSSLKFQVSDQKEHMPGVLTSNLTLDTSNSPPDAVVDGVTCETNRAPSKAGAVQQV